MEKFNDLHIMIKVLIALVTLIIMFTFAKISLFLCILTLVWALNEISKGNTPK